VVTAVALLVMVYSHGYMEHDPGYVRFFAYLSLFSSSMLGLVLSPNLIQVYIFWELVGMCSYLLIGFWFSKKAAADAAQKAFVTNRVGDFGLLLGILGLFLVTKSFDFSVIAERLGQLYEVAKGASPEGMGLAVDVVKFVQVNPQLSLGLATIVCLLAFMGPMAKSAQFPLHVWLPDAMEGPTPISALIHAATMVAAGVFLVARMFSIFEALPTVMTFIAWTGGITGVVGATIALTQMDIKKGLAYSTISQLGYMMLAMGLGAYTAAIFHLMTHAFFKAMLFLGSGSVIHSMEGVLGHENAKESQDMRLMGGLKEYMPITSKTFLVGCLAISGIFPLSGFWSKDAVLGAAFSKGLLEGFEPSAAALWLIGLVTAGMTAFYMFRMYFLTFEGEFRGQNAEVFALVKTELSVGQEEEETAHAEPNHSHGEVKEPEHHPHAPHESPWAMTMPLAILAVPSLFAGLIGMPWMDWFGEAIHAPGPHKAHEFIPFEFAVVAGSSTVVSLAGIALAYYLYILKPELPGQIAQSIKPLYQFSKRKWYMDDLYEGIFVRGSRALAQTALTTDKKVIDGAVNLSGFGAILAGEGLKYFESGRAQFYVLVFFGAIIPLVLLFGLL
jgi:NAD(P)H-quinone oxidoreductase subunit 5